MIEEGRKEDERRTTNGRQEDKTAGEREGVKWKRQREDSKRTEGGPQKGCGRREAGRGRISGGWK